MRIALLRQRHAVPASPLCRRQGLSGFLEQGVKSRAVLPAAAKPVLRLTDSATPAPVKFRMSRRRSLMLSLTTLIARAFVKKTENAAPLQRQRSARPRNAARKAAAITNSAASLTHDLVGIELLEETTVRDQRHAPFFPGR